MCMLKPDFCQMVQAIEDIRMGKQVAWDEVISHAENEMQEAYEEILDKVDDVKERVKDIVSSGSLSDCQEELAEIIDDLRSWM